MKIIEKIKADRLAVLVACVFIGILLVLASSFFKTSDNNSNNNNELNDYISTLETSLENTISQIKGAGETSVLVTLESSYETVYASNATLEESGSENAKNVLSQKQLAYYSSGSSGENPVVVKQILPKICGVLVVCEGGNINEVKNEIISSVSTAMGISKNKIYVTGGVTNEKVF